MSEKNFEKRPWGEYTVLKSGGGFKVKSIIVNPGQKLSLQLHHKRAEHWILAKGTMIVAIGEKRINMKKGDIVFIPKETKHRMENPGKKLAEIIEIQIGEYLGEDDIERFDDIYGRI